MRAKDGRVHQEFRDQVDSGYWLCLVFQSRDHCTRFLARYDLQEYGSRYLDADTVLRATGLPVDESARRPEWKAPRPPSKKMQRYIKR